MAYVVHNPQQYAHQPLVGVGPRELNKGQCAALAQSKGIGVPATCHWRRGKRVADCKPGELMLGTVIATFNKNHDYVSTHAAAHSHQFHAALYVRHNSHTMTIVERFVGIPGGKIRQQTIKLAPSSYVSRVSRDANNYYVVELKPYSHKPQP